MYSCHKDRLEVVQTKTVKWQGFDSAKKCRFDLRYDEMHQQLGCNTCIKPWDSVYLKQQGLLK